MPKNDKSTQTQIVEMAAEMGKEVIDYIEKAEPIPFMKRKVSGSEISRQVKPAMQGNDFMKIQEVIDKYGFDAVNETMGRMMSKNGGQ